MAVSWIAGLILAAGGITLLGTDDLLTDRSRIQRTFQDAGIQHVDKILQFFATEISGDLTLIRDRAIDVRCRMNPPVEQNRHLSLISVRRGRVPARQMEEPTCPFFVQSEIDAGLPAIVESDGNPMQKTSCDSCVVDLTKDEKLADDSIAIKRFVSARDLRGIEIFRLSIRLKGSLMPSRDDFTVALELILVHWACLSLIDQRPVIMRIGHDGEFHGPQSSDQGESLSSLVGVDSRQAHFQSALIGDADRHTFGSAWVESSANDFDRSSQHFLRRWLSRSGFINGEFEYDSAHRFECWRRRTGREKQQANHHAKSCRAKHSKRIRSQGGFHESLP